MKKSGKTQGTTTLSQKAEELLKLTTSEIETRLAEPGTLTLLLEMAKQVVDLEMEVCSRPVRLNNKTLLHQEISINGQNAGYIEVCLRNDRTPEKYLYL
jgi:hypothetical protein